MKQYIKKSLFISLMINIVGGLAAADPSVQNAKKRIERLVKQVQPKEQQAPILEPADVAATTEFMATPGYCQSIKDQWFPQLVKHSDAIRKMLENEERFQETHFVFYHAQRQENRLVVEMLRHVYEFEFKKQLPTDF